MNKIFKVVWSKTKECYVVVSEVAKNNGGKKKVLASVLAGLAMVGAGAAGTPVQAATDYNKKVNISPNGTMAGGYSANNSVSDNSIVVGYGNDTSTGAQGNGHVAYGFGNTSTEDTSTALGGGNKATGPASTAVGSFNEATARAAIAMGNVSKATGERSVAIGSGAEATQAETIAVGREAKATAGQTVAIGRLAKADQQYATAMGYNAQATGSSSLALGRDSSSSGSSSVAVGYTNKAKQNVAVALGVNNDVDGEESTAVGSSNTIATNANQASVIGRKNKVNRAGSFVGGFSNVTNGERNVAVGSENTTTGEESIGIGTKVIAGTGKTIAIGGVYNPGGGVEKQTIARGDDTINPATGQVNNVFALAIGNGAQADGKDNKASGMIAIGQDVLANNTNAMALGIQAKATGRSSMAFGQAANAAGSGAFALGQSTNATSHGSIAMGNGAQSTGSGSTALGRTAKALNDGTVALGFSAEATGDGAIAIGGDGKGAAFDSTNTTFAGLGEKTTATAKNAVAVGHQATASIAGGVALGSESKTTKDAGEIGYNPAAGRTNKYDNLTNNTKAALTSTRAAVSIGDDSTSVTRQLTGLAAGTQDTDAVNVAQLKAVNLKFAGDSTQVTGSTDVRLNDGTFNVNGDGTLISTEATATGIKVKAKVGGTINNTDGKAVKPTTNGIATTDNVADAINDSYWKATAGGNTDGTPAVGKVKPGTQVTYSAGDNLKVKQTINNTTGDQEYKYSLNPVLTGITSIANTTTGPKMTFGGSSINITGGSLNMGDNKITNLATGTDDKDAVNVKQLKDTEIHITPGTYTPDSNKKVTLTYENADNKTVTGKTAVIDLSGLATGGTTSTEKVQKAADATGDKNIAEVGPKSGDTFGAANATYEVSVSRNAVKDAAREAVTINNGGTKSGTTYTPNADNPITVTPKEDAANHNTTYEVTFDGNKAAKQIPLTYKANGNGAKTVTLEKGLDFTNGTNTTAVIGNDGVVKYNLNKDVDLSNTGSLTIGDTKVTNGGVTITAPAGGTTSNVTLTQSGLDNGGNKIINVAPGTLSSTSTDAVNGSQLYTVDQKFNNKINLGADGSTETTKFALDNTGGIKFNIKGDGSGASGANQYISTTANGSNVNVDLTADAKAKLNKTYTVSSGSTNVTVTPTTTGDNTDFKITVASTGTTTSSSWNLATDKVSATEGTVAAGSAATQNIADTKTVTMKAGKNLTVKQTNDGTGNASVAYSLDKDISVETVTVTGQNGKDGSIGINGKDGVTRNITVEVPGQAGQPGTPGVDGTTTTRIVFDGKAQANLDDGLKFTGNNESTENKHKLNTLVKVQGEGTKEGTDATGTKEIQTSDGTKFESAKDNIAVEANGADTLTVKLNKNLKGLDSVTTKEIKLGDANDNISIKKDGDRITYTTNNGGTATTNKVANLADEKHITQGNYTVGDKTIDTNAADDEVTLTYTDGNGNLVKDTANNPIMTKIKGIAKSDLTNINDAGKKVITGLGSVVKAGDNVTVKTDTDATTGQKTYTVNAVTPAVYTKADGTKVIKRPDGTFTTNLDGSAGNDVPASDVIVSFQDAAGNTTGGNSIVNNVGSAIDKTGTSTGDTFLTKLDNAATATPNAAVNVKDLKNTSDAIIGKGLKFDANEGGEKTNKLGSKVTVQGTGTLTAGKAYADEYNTANIRTNIEQGTDGNTTINVGLAKALKDINSISNGGSSITISNVPAGATTPAVTISGGNLSMGDGTTNNKIVNLAPGTDGTDAVNLNQLKGMRTVVTSTDKSVTVTSNENSTTGQVTYDLKVATTGTVSKSTWDLKSGVASATEGTHSGDTTQTIADTKSVTMQAGKNLTVKQTNDGTGNASVAYSLDKDISVETVTVTGQNGKDGSIGINGKDGVTRNITVEVPGQAGQPGTPGVDGTTTTRIVFDGKAQANLDDGLKFTGNNESTENKHKLNTLVKVQGEGTKEGTDATGTKEIQTSDGTKFESAKDNIAVEANGADTLTVKLNKNLKGLDSVTTKEIKLGDANDNISIKKDGDRITYTTNNGGTATTNKVANLADEKHITQGNYTVGDKTIDTNAADDEVTLTYTDGNGNLVKDTANNPIMTKIKGIAKSDLTNINDAGKKVITGLGSVVKAGDNVTVKTDTDATTGQKTYTVNAVTPAVYTKADGTKVIKRPDGTFTTNLDGSAGNDVPASDVIVSFQDAAGNTTGGNSIVNNVGSAIDKPGTATGNTFLTQLDNAAANTPFAAVNVRDLKTTADALKANERHIAPTTVATGSTETKGGTANAAGTANVYKYDATSKTVTLTYNDGNGNAVTDTKAVIDLSNLSTGGTGASSWNIASDKVSATEGAVATGSAGTQNIADGKTVTMKAGKNLTVNQSNDGAGNASVAFSLDKNLENLDKVVVNGNDGATGQAGVSIVGPKGANGVDGNDGKVGIAGKDGKDAVSISGKDGVGHIGLQGPKGTPGTPGAPGAPGANLDITTDHGTQTLVKPERNNNNQSERIVYVPKDASGNPLKDTDGNDIKREVATMDDGLKFTGNNTATENKHKLGSLVKVQGEGVTAADEAAFQSASGNIAVTADGTDTLTIRLNKNLKGLNSIQLGDNTIKSNGDNIEFTTKGGDTKTVATTDQLWTIQANGTDVPAKSGKVNLVAGDHITITPDAANGKMTISATGFGSMDGFNVKTSADANGTHAGDTTENIKNGKTVDMQAGKNLVVTQTNDGSGNTTVNYALNKDVDLGTNGSLKTGDTTINNDGFKNGNTTVGGNGMTIKDPTDPTKTVSLTKDGLNNGGNQITNVASGGNVDTNAANIGDIKRLAKDTRIKDGTYTVDNNGTVELTYVDGNGNQVKDASGNAITAKITGLTTLDSTRVNVAVNETGSGKAVGSKAAVKVTKGTEFVAGDNLIVERKANAGTDVDNSVVYSLNKDLKGIETIKNGNTTITLHNNPTTATDPTAVTITGGNINMGGNRIVNVAPAKDGTDAVNLDQLKAARTKVTSNDGTVTIRSTEDKTTGQMTYDLHVTPGQSPDLTRITNKVDQLGEEIGRVGAQGAALSALKPIQYDPLEPTQIMAGYGNYRGNSAVALGVAHYKNESTLIHGGVSWAGGSSHMMANAGVTWKVGNRDSEAAVADRYRKGPISSAYAMQQEMAAMKAQNAGLKGEVSDLKAENEQMKAQIAAMMAKLGL